MTAKVPRNRVGANRRPPAEARVFERQVWELWVRGATPQQIAEQTGRSLKNVQDGLARAREYRAAMDDVEPIRQQRLAGLMQQRLDVERQLAAPQPLLDRAGRVLMRTREKDDGTTEQVPIIDQVAFATLQRTLIAIDKQVAALTGSDAAKRFEVVVGAPDEMEERALIGELKERAAQIRLAPRREAITVESTPVEPERREA